MTTHLSDDVAALHVYQQPKLIYINSEISAKNTHLFLLSHRPTQFLSCEISIRHRSIPWTNQQLKTWITPASKARANLNTNWLPDMLRGRREGRGDSNSKFWFSRDTCTELWLNFQLQFCMLVHNHVNSHNVFLQGFHVFNFLAITRSVYYRYSVFICKYLFVILPNFLCQK